MSKFIASIKYYALICDSNKGKSVKETEKLRDRVEWYGSPFR